MTRMPHADPHLSLTEVQHQMRTGPSAMLRQRWLSISNALVKPRKAEEIARHCGGAKATSML